MTAYRLLSLSLLSLLLGCQGMAPNANPAPTVAENHQPSSTTAAAQLTLDSLPTLRCPAGQACDDESTYRALQWQSSGAEVYLSFAGSLADARDPASLNQHFGYADIYLPQPDGRVMAVHAAPDAKAEAQLRFLPAPAGRLRAQLLLKQHRLQSDGKQSEPVCRTDDMQGVCRRETTVSTPLTLDLDLAWPVR